MKEICEEYKNLPKTFPEDFSWPKRKYEDKFYDDNRLMDKLIEEGLFDKEEFNKIEKELDKESQEMRYKWCQET